MVGVLLLKDDNPRKQNSLTPGFSYFSPIMYICLYKADKIVYNCYIVLLRDAVVIFYFKAVKCPLIQ